MWIAEGDARTSSEVALRLLHHMAGTWSCSDADLREDPDGCVHATPAAAAIRRRMHLPRSGAAAAHCTQTAGQGGGYSFADAAHPTWQARP